MYLGFLAQTLNTGLEEVTTSAQGELVKAEPLECDLINFVLAILKTYVGLISEI